MLNRQCFCVRGTDSWEPRLDFLVQHHGSLTVERGCLKVQEHLLSFHLFQQRHGCCSRSCLKIYLYKLKPSKNSACRQDDTFRISGFHLHVNILHFVIMTQHLLKILKQNSLFFSNMVSVFLLYRILYFF